MKPRRLSLAAKKKKKPAKEAVKETEYFDEELEPVEVEMIPEDQIVLTAAELDEEITKTLTSLDPNKPAKRTHFNFHKGAFESIANTEHIAVHIKQEGVIWSIKERDELEKLQKEQTDADSPEAQADEAKDSENQDKAADDEAQDKDEAKDEDAQDKDAQDKDEAEADDDDAKDTEEAAVGDTQKKKEVLVKNQFNFSDRASQTFNEPLRDRQVQTEPAPKSVFSENATPSSIRDEYLKNLLKQKAAQLEEENKKKKSGFAAGGNTASESANVGKSDSKVSHLNETQAILHSKSMLKALKIMERVAVLNANSDSYHEFQYYTASDYKRGSFLSRLWRFAYSECGNKMVTCLEWNKKHLDLFAVGYGSYDFNLQTSGMICVYSLKSTAFPEKIIHCESGVMCMSFHPKHASLICVGSYDGSVAVYDIRNVDGAPIYSSSNPETHHDDPVTDIEWYFDELQHDLVFYTISSDSEIKVWKMAQNELAHETFIKLTTPGIAVDPDALNGMTGDAHAEADVDDDADGEAALPALCSCFDFNRFMPHVYLVGTEDGHVLECNKTSTDGYSKIYAAAHFMNVYAVKWNPFHSKVFLTCSEDWTIKLWEMEPDRGKEKGKDRALMGDEEDEPIITYDLGCSVNDIAWSPFSSTIFCAVTNDGKVHVFDLAQNKNAPLCSQQITKKSKSIRLIKVSFPIGFPIIMVGDEKGNVYALKLSPNLYLNKMKHKDILKNVCPTMFDDETFKSKEKEKLINVLNVTGKKVFDVIEHFSPKPKKMGMKSPQR